MDDECLWLIFIVFILEIYGQMFPEMQDEAAEMVDDLITPMDVELIRASDLEALYFGVPDGGRTHNNLIHSQGLCH